jgi:actin-related protein 6
VFPNCTAKPKGERQVYVGDALLDAKDIMSLNMRRPFDRVRARAGDEAKK